MTPATLRRKLYKKKKHRVYGNCPACGGRTERRVTWDEGRNTYRLFARCQNGKVCKYEKEFFWSGGGTADTYRGPQDPSGKA